MKEFTSYLSERIRVDPDFRSVSYFDHFYQYLLLGYPRLKVKNLREELMNENKSELLNIVWAHFWDMWDRQLNTTIEFRSNHFTHEAIEELEKKNRMIIYVPEELSSIESINILQQMFSYRNPSAESDMTGALKGYTNIPQSGWIHVEPDIFTPSPGESTQTPQTINTYFVASLFYKHLRGNYFDEDAGRLSLIGGTISPEGSPLIIRPSMTDITQIYGRKAKVIYSFDLYPPDRIDIAQQRTAGVS